MDKYEIALYLVGCFIIAFIVIKILTKIVAYFVGYDCHYCGRKSQYKTVTNRNVRIYLCAECMRGFRFRETEYFKKIESIKDNKFQARRK